MAQDLTMHLSKRLEQQLTMTPQLLQSIQLLQYTSLELSEWLEEELLENPVLEITEETGKKDEDEVNSTEEDSEEVETESDDDDFEWEEYLNDGRDIGYTSSKSFSTEEKDSFESFTAAEVSLTEHMHSQLSLVINSEEDFKIGMAIISSLDEKGFLKTDIETLQDYLDVPVEQIEKVRKIILRLDPFGTASKNIQEFLLLQLEQNALKTSWAYEIVDKYFDLVKKNKIKDISRKLKITPGAVQKAIDTISKLEPFPSGIFSNNDNSVKYIIPDVIIKKINGQWDVIINDENVPYLRISPFYRNLIMNSNKKNVKKYLKEKMNAAFWVIKSIHQRNETLYKVVKCIIDLQKDFFDKGIMHLQPLILKDVAEIVKLHESTVSRATSNKYAQTPFGLFNLKFFFSSKIGKEGEEDASSTVIKEKIKNYILEEDSTNPLSDTQIWKMLKDEGYSIGRRAVAKYREEQKLLPRYLRKRV